MTVIETQALGKTYDGEVMALRDLSLSPSSGGATILGYPAGDERIRSATATVAELARRIDELLELLEISDRRETRLGALSTGLKKRVHIARALLHRLRLLFLDEPTSGLDPESARHVIGLVRELAEREETSIFLCTHNLPLAERICTNYGFLVAGTMVWSGSRDELLRATMPTKSVTITTDRGEQTIEIENDTHINAAIRRVMETGAQILEVRQVQPSLEEAYFTIVEGGMDEHESVAS